MTPGVSTLSIASQGTWALFTGTGDANYPVANLTDLVRPSNVCRITPAAGAINIRITFPSSLSMQFLALVNHTLPAGATVRIRPTTGTNGSGTVLFDSGAIAVWASGAPLSGFKPTFPYLGPSLVSARSVQLDFASAGSSPVEFGAIEVGQWMPWNIGEGIEVGFETRAADVTLVGGGAEAGDMPMARIANGQIDKLSLSTLYPQFLDFQKAQGKNKPFVYVEDLDDATTFARRCFLARNTDLPPLVGALYRSDRFQFRLREQMR